MLRLPVGWEASNAEQAGSTARDLDLKTALQSALQGTPATDGTALATTAPGHLAGNPGVAAEAGLLYRTPAQGSVAGNTVNMDAERAAFAGGAVHYEFNLTRITQQIKTMMAAIQG